AGLLAGRRVKAGRRAPGYGMNAGEVICSEPVAASGMGVPAAAPAGCRNTLERFFSPPTKARRSPARETANWEIETLDPLRGVTCAVARSALTTCVTVRPPCLCSTRYASDPSRKNCGELSRTCGVLVKARWFEPSFDISQMSSFRSRVEPNEMVSPSGDTAG